MLVAGIIIVGFLGIFTAVLCSSTPINTPTQPKEKTAHKKEKPLNKYEKKAIERINKLLEIN